MPQSPRNWLHWLRSCAASCSAATGAPTRPSLLAGLNGNAISQFLNGKRPAPRACLALANLFGVPPDELLRLAGHAPSRPEPSADRRAIDQLLARLLTDHLRVVRQLLELLSGV